MFGRLVMSLLLSIFTMNYTKANNTYFAVPKDDPRDRIHLEVGDSKQSDFHPQMKIMRWDNEVNFSMRLVHSEKSPKVSKAGNKIKWQGDKTEAHFYDLPFSEELPEGGHECEILIYEPVPDNRIEFTIKYKNLRFYYQDFDFTPEEIAEGAILGSRPEHIKGSYAVYTATPKTNYEGGKLYRCNKVGHIPRPRLEDAVGKWCWGILNIETIDAENAILRVAMPKDFADTAVYPIRHAAGATFGYTTGGTAGSTAYTDCRAMIGASYIHAAVTGETVTKFSMWAKSSGGSTGYDMAAYSMSGGLPVTRLGTPVTVVLPTTSPPVAFTDSAEVSQAMTNGVSYCCAFGNDGSGTETLYWDTGSGNMRSNDTTTGAMPPTWTHSAYSAALMSIYATYSAGSTLSGTQAESAGAVDAQSATNIAVASQAESASAVDAPSATKTTAASQVESAGAVDVQSGVMTTAASQAEAAGAVDIPSATKTTGASQVEAAGAVDAQSGVTTTAASQIESVGAVDVQSATIIAVAIQAESAGATDLISATKIIADAKNWLRSGYWWNYPYN